MKTLLWIKSPAKWSIGSEVHLDGLAEKDLVVLPRFDLDLRPSNGCLMGANIGPFWAFANTSKGYDLVLDTSALSLEVLNSRTKGYRDIRGAQASDEIRHSNFQI